jgi:hypothetical protein
MFTIYVIIKILYYHTIAFAAYFLENNKKIDSNELFKNGDCILITFDLLKNPKWLSY